MGKKTKIAPGKVAIVNANDRNIFRTPAQQGLNSLISMMSQIQANGEEPVEIFSIILTKKKNVAISAIADVTTEYVAVFIDILENTLQQMNGVQPVEVHELHEVNSVRKSKP